MEIKMFIKELLKFTQSEIIYNISLSCLYILFCFVGIKIINFVLKILEKKAKQTQYNADFALIVSLEKPARTMVWLFGFYEIFKIFNKKFVFLREIKVGLGIFIALWICFRFISQYTKRIIEIKEAKKENIDYGGISFFQKMSQIITFFIIIMFGLGKLGINFQSLMAIGGVGGMAIGFAAKDMLSNIFGGLTIFLDKPFTVGDWICSPDRDIEGDVEEIGWRQTRILTFAKFPIYVANSIFSTIIIQNKTRMRSRRINELIPIKYMNTTLVENIIKDIKDMLKNHGSINQRLITIVCLESIAMGKLNIRVYTFANTIEWLRYTEIQQDVLIKIINIVKSYGGDIAYDVKEILFNKDNEKENLLISKTEEDVLK